MVVRPYLVSGWPPGRPGQPTFSLASPYKVSPRPTIIARTCTSNVLRFHALHDSRRYTTPECWAGRAAPLTQTQMHGVATAMMSALPATFRVELASHPSQTMPLSGVPYINISLAHRSSHPNSEVKQVKAGVQ